MKEAATQGWTTHALERQINTLYLWALLQIFGVPSENGLNLSGGVPSEFNWRHFEGEIILWAVRWYCRYGISYRDLEQMMGERGVPVDYSTIYRWF
jgi:hypothetical protein